MQDVRVLPERTWANSSVRLEGGEWGAYYKGHFEGLVRVYKGHFEG